MFEKLFRDKEGKIDTEEGLPDEVPETPRAPEVTDAIKEATDPDTTFEDGDVVEAANVDEDPKELNFDDDRPMAA